MCIPFLVLGQNDSLSALINDISENESYYTDLLLDLKEQPIQINYANKKDFMQLPLFSSEMADTVIAHREKYGPYTSKKQLRVMIDPELYDLLKPYLTTQDKGYHEMQLTHREIYQIEKNPDIESGKFKGNALNSYSRFKYQYNPAIDFGFITQKDPGESSLVDHLNFFAQYKSKGWHFILGNYYLRFGQGLTHSNPYGNQKSIYLSALFREPSSFGRPNLSSSESSGKFGLYLEKEFNNDISVFSFYSNSKRDAQLTDSVLTGITYDGYHRSENEIAARKYFSELNWGAGFKFNPLNSIQISGIINQYNFNRAIQRNAALIGENDFRRNYYGFSGAKLKQAAISYIIHFNHLKLSAEYSTSNMGKPGWTQSISFFKKDFKIGATYWELDKKFQSIDGRSFDDAGPFPQGVKGFFAGIQFKPTPNSTLSAYKKAEQKTWRSYFDPLPTANNEWLVQADFRINKTAFSTRLRHRVKEEFKEGQKGNQRLQREQNTIRLQLDYKPLKTVSARTRWEQVSVMNPGENGTLLFQDLKYFFSSSLSINTRYTFFKSASWASRIYEYEADLPGTFSNLALSGNGNKIYMLLKWQALPSLSLWFKWRYIVTNDFQKNGRYYKDLNRDIRGQIRFKL